MSTLLIAIVSFLKIFMIAFLYLLEYKFFNKKVFEEFYFPYVVTNMKEGSLAAFASGLKSEYVIQIILSFVYLLPIFKHYEFYISLTIFSFIYLLYVMIKDKILDKKIAVYKYHELYYDFLICLELMYIIIKIYISIYLFVI